MKITANLAVALKNSLQRIMYKLYIIIYSENECQEQSSAKNHEIFPI